MIVKLKTGKGKVVAMHVKPLPTPPPSLDPSASESAPLPLPPLTPPAESTLAITEDSLATQLQLEQFRTRLEKALQSSQDADVKVRRIWCEAVTVCGEEQCKQLALHFAPRLHLDVELVPAKHRKAYKRILLEWNCWPWELGGHLPDKLTRRWLSALRNLAISCGKDEAVRLVQECCQGRVDRTCEVKTWRGIPRSECWLLWDLERALEVFHNTLHATPPASEVEEIGPTRSPSPSQSPDLSPDATAIPQNDIPPGITVRSKKRKSSAHTTEDFTRSRSKRRLHERLYARKRQRQDAGVIPEEEDKEEVGLTTIAEQAEEDCQNADALEHGGAEEDKALGYNAVEHSNVEDDALGHSGVEEGHVRKNGMAHRGLNGIGAAASMTAAAQSKDQTLFREQRVDEDVASSSDSDSSGVDEDTDEDSIEIGRIPELGEEIDVSFFSSGAELVLDYGDPVQSVNSDDLEKFDSEAISMQEKVENWKSEWSAPAPSIDVSSQPSSPIRLGNNNLLTSQVDGGNDVGFSNHITIPKNMMSGPHIDNPSVSLLSRKVSAKLQAHAAAELPNSTAKTDFKAIDNDDEVLVSKHSLRPSTASNRPPEKVDVSRFDDKEWLGDSNIDDSLALIPRSARCMVLSATYLGIDDTRPFGKLRLGEETECILVPLPLKRPDEHWCLGIIHLRDGLVEFYNPLPMANYRKSGEAILMRFTTYLSSNFTRLHDVQWEFRELTDLPKQQNGHDCGIFVIVVAIHRLIAKTLPKTIYGWVWRPVLAQMIRLANAAENDSARAESDPQSLVVDGSLPTSASDLTTDAVEELDRLFQKNQRQIIALQTTRETIQGVLGHISEQEHMSARATSTDELLRKLDALTEQLHRDIPAPLRAAAEQGHAGTRAAILKMQEQAKAAALSLARLKDVWNAGSQLVKDKQHTADELERSLRSRIDSAVARSDAQIDRELEVLQSKKRALEGLRARMAR